MICPGLSQQENPICPSRKNQFLQNKNIAYPQKQTPAKISCHTVFNIIIIILYSIYRALIPNGPKVLYIMKITTNPKPTKLRNYIVIL